MQKYNPQEIEKKWQKAWRESGIYKVKDLADKPKFYALDMFPYPSGAGLHVGHPKGYIATDVASRMKMLQGLNVLHPMGWDAFGLPAENYAIKNKIHPRISTEKNIAVFKEQLEKFGFTYDWDIEVNTTDPEFYKWTQWIFLKMFEKGLAYESNEPVNWCSSCKTVLSNEDLEGGLCERCGTQVIQKKMKQWVLKMTAYAERLLNDLDKKDLDWEELIKEQQRNWIGRSEGLLFKAPVKDTNIIIETFSAHFEAFCADTFVVIAPDHSLLPKLVEGIKNKSEILDFSKKLVEKRLNRGFDEEKESEGMFTGRYIIDPVGNGELPIWIASYALANYGTGIVKCSAHDERDFKFAKKYGIKLKTVLYPQNLEEKRKVEAQEICFSDMKNSVLSEPYEFVGKVAGGVRKEIVKYIEEKGLAKPKITYRLRDWVFSRQRYWGEPIPIIHCGVCGAVGVPEKDLPVRLPDVESYEPTGTGESPLANITEWVNTTCPKCGLKAKRETNTMPQWAGSSWYYLRYIDPKNTKELVNKEKEKYWMNVDLYVGGAEHATRHLLYARFWHKFLFDIGVVSTDEPFKKLFHVGLILAQDGRKMSKRWGNVVNPDDIISEFGADSMRLYVMFMGPFSQAVSWSTKGVVGMKRFLERVWQLNVKCQMTNDKLISNDELLNHKSQITNHKQNTKHDNQTNTGIQPLISLERLLHKTIKKVGEDIEGFKFNTAISALMILSNEFEKQENLPKEYFEKFLILLSPFTPHIVEELWNKLGNKESIFLSQWPAYDKNLIKEEEIEMLIQVNGKLRDKIKTVADISEDEVKKLALTSEKIQKEILGKEIKKVIFVKNRLVNIVSSEKLPKTP